MRPDFRATVLAPAFLLLWFAIPRLVQGQGTVGGLARLSGPLRSCQTRISGMSSGSLAANRTTDINGVFNASFSENTDEVFKVDIQPGASCVDLFTKLSLPFQLSAAVPLNASQASVGYASFMCLSHLELVVAAGPNSTDLDVSTSATSKLTNNASVVRQNMTELYGTFNISLHAYGLDSLQLQPFSMLPSANATTRNLAVALLAADVEMGALAVLGAALLNASVYSTTGVVANVTVMARIVAAEGMRQLVQLEAMRQVLLAEEAAEAAARNATAATNTGSGLTTLGSPVPSSPPSPPPAPSASSVGGLYTLGVVYDILTAAANRANVTVLSYAVNATAEVVSGISSYAEVLKRVALLELMGSNMGLNPLNAFISLTRLAAVQADAANQMSNLLGSDPAALHTYVLDALPERLSKSSVDVAAIHVTVGLPPPAAPVAASGAVHMIGPLSGCVGQANDMWTPRYEAFVTTGLGALSLRAKGQGSVAVSPYRYCQDNLSLIQLSMTVSNLGPSMPAVSVSPVAMLAQGFYTLQAAHRLTTVTMAQQTAAFTAMGLDLAAYNDFMIKPPANTSSSPPPSLPSPRAQLASPPPSPPAPINLTSIQTFNLSHPLMGSVIAANSQMVGVFYAIRALFTTSCYYAYDLDSGENAVSFIGTLTTYVAALLAEEGGGVLNLTDEDQLNAMFAFVAEACYFNSTALTKQISNAPPVARGTFLSGGSASAVGAATTRDRRRRHLMAQRQLHMQESLGPDSSRHLAASSLPRGVCADLVIGGVVSPQALMRQQMEPGPELGQPAGGDAGWGGDERADGGGKGMDRRTNGAGGRKRRRLTVYVDDPDMVNVYNKVAEILSGINTRLQAIQSQSKAAAGTPDYATSYNLTDLVTKSAQLGFVLQYSLYSELANAMSADYNSGLLLVTAIQNIATRYTGTALTKRMEEAAINKAYICGAAGAQCWIPSPLPTPVDSGGGDSSSKKSSKAPVFIGIGVGVGVVVIVLVGLLLYRYKRKRQIKRTVVNNFKNGDMNQMTLRLASTLPPNCLDGTMGGKNGGGSIRQGKSAELYHSLVPAALGSDPTVAQDYPLYPTANGSAALNSTAGSAAGRISRTGAAAHVSSGPGGLSAHLPPPKFPVQPERMSFGGPVLPVPPLQQALGTAGGTPSQQLNSSINNGYVTYPNSAFVHAEGGSDATALRNNAGGSYSCIHQRSYPTGQHHPDAASGSVSASQIAADGSSRAGGGGTPWQQSSGPLPPGLGTASSPPLPIYGANGTLNGTLGRRSGLPPLAPYMSVTNASAPTATLNASLRAIPVNSNFNSSLRHPSHSAGPAGYHANSADGIGGGYQRGPSAH